MAHPVARAVRAPPRRACRRRDAPRGRRGLVRGVASPASRIPARPERPRRRSRLLRLEQSARPGSALPRGRRLRRELPVRGRRRPDLCDRWRHRGWPIVHAQDAGVWHTPGDTLASFWRQHFRYGRGARVFHRFRAERRGHGERPPPGFYLRLVLFPLRRARGARAPVLVLLAALSQVATALGYVAEIVTPGPGWIPLKLQRRQADPSAPERRASARAFAPARTHRRYRP